MDSETQDTSKHRLGHIKVVFFFIHRQPVGEVDSLRHHSGRSLFNSDDASIGTGLLQRLVYILPGR